MFYENGRQKQQQAPNAAAATAGQDGFSFDDFPALGGAAAGSDGSRYAQGMVPQRRPLQPPPPQQQQQPIDLNQSALLKHRNTLLGVMTGDSGGGSSTSAVSPSYQSSSLLPRPTMSDPSQYQQNLLPEDIKVGEPDYFTVRWLTNAI